MESKPPIINLMGATAMGKTAIAIGLSKLLPIRIISVDSALIYKGMNIGTAKPTEEELEQAPHHLINLITPDQNYSAADFVHDVKAQIEIARAQNQIPLLVGGSMFYFHALLQGINDIPATTIEVRKQLSEQAQQIGWAAMHEKLKVVDPESADKIHPNHSQRLQRALEVYTMTGKPLSQWQQQETTGLLATQHCLTIALTPSNRDILHKRIAERFINMLNNGFEAEVKHLLKQYPNAETHNAFKLVGYRQMLSYLRGEINTKALQEQGTIATRQLAKRQMTWLRQWKSPLCWVQLDEANQLEEKIKLIAQLASKPNYA